MKEFVHPFYTLSLARVVTLVKFTGVSSNDHLDFFFILSFGLDRIKNTNCQSNNKHTHTELKPFWDIKSELQKNLSLLKYHEKQCDRFSTACLDRPFLHD